VSNNSYDPETDPLHPYLFASVHRLPIEPVHIATRCQNVMRLDNIVYIGDVVFRTEAEWLRKPNFSQVSLIALKLALSRLGLRLGMRIPEWPPSQERLEEVRSQCMERGLWDFDNLAAQKINADTIAYDETMEALQAIEHELCLVKMRLARLRNKVLANGRLAADRSRRCA